MKISDFKDGISTISPGPRFGHFIIDLFLIQIIAYLVDVLPFIELTGFLQLLLFPAYYIVFEYYFQRTPGKYVTNTIVIDDFGKRPGIQTILLRTFIRFVPFEPFSCLQDRSMGWHDTWSKSYVIKMDDLSFVLEKLGNSGNEENLVNSGRKVKKNLLILFILCVVLISGYCVIREIRKGMSMTAENVFAELNQQDANMLLGEWTSDWRVYKGLIFKKGNALTGINQKGESLELKYTLKAKVLSITDTLGLKLEYVVLELTGKDMVLRDLETMRENIVFERK